MRIGYSVLFFVILSVVVNPYDSRRDLRSAQDDTIEKSG